MGGYDYLVYSTVACYNSSGWTRLKDLYSTRRFHRAIMNDDKVYIVGGSGTK